MKSALAGAISTSCAQRASSMWPIAASAALVPQIAARGPARDGLKGHGRDELLRGGGHHHLHFGAALDQAAHQIGTLVGGDAAGDPQQDSCLRRQWMPLSSLKRAMSLSNCLLMVASSLRFSRRFSSWVRMSLPTRTRSSAN